MTLATHIVTGAAAAKLFSTHPIQAFFIGWLTHYILDSIIHWDYPVRSFVKDESNPMGTKIALSRPMILDITSVLLDISIGFVIVLLLGADLSMFNMSIVLLGAFGGVVPDFFQFLFGVLKIQPLRILQRFHNFMHHSKNLNDRPIVGITTQVCIVFLAGALLYAAL